VVRYEGFVVSSFNRKPEEPAEEKQPFLRGSSAGSGGARVFDARAAGSRE